MAKRTQYSMYHQNATVGKIGRITPFMILPVCPGDTWQGVVGQLIRLSPMKKALLQDIYVDCFVHYVPNRLLMSDWEDFIAEGPVISPTYSIPTVTVGAGVNTYDSVFQISDAADASAYSAFPTYALNLIWNEFFRDDDQAVRAPTATPGEVGIAVNFKKDYWSTLQDDIGYPDDDHYFDTNVGSGTQASAREVLEAIAKQKAAMKRATYGTRYVDILRSYGINVNYQMLQRPETVAISRGTINVTDVVSTSDATGATLGELAGHGISGGRLKLRRKTFPEHGILMGTCVLRPTMSDSAMAEWHDTAHTYEHFWDPGLFSLPPVTVTKFDVTPSIDLAQRADVLGYQPWGEWYRKALSRKHTFLANAGVGVVIPDFLPKTDYAIDDLRTISSNDYDAIFSDSSTLYHWQGSFVNKLKVLRRLPRANASALRGT